LGFLQSYSRFAVSLFLFPHLSKVKNNMNSKDVKIIIAVIVVVIIAVILYSMYERNKDENMGNLNNQQGSTLVSPMHSITSNT